MESLCKILYDRNGIEKGENHHETNWVAIFTMAILLLITAGCSNDQQKAQDRFDKYVAMWNKEDFEGMYGYLSKDAKKTISEKDFVNRYKNIYDAIEADKLKVKASKIEDLEIKDHKAVLPFEVNMNSVAGEISFKENAAVVQENKGIQRIGILIGSLI